MDWAIIIELSVTPNKPVVTSVVGPFSSDAKANQWINQFREEYPVDNQKFEIIPMYSPHAN